MLGGGGRLGGRIDTKGKTPRELAAEVSLFRLLFLLMGSSFVI